MEALAILWALGLALGLTVPAQTLLLAVVPAVIAGILAGHFWWAERSRSKHGPPPDP